MFFPWHILSALPDMITMVQSLLRIAHRNKEGQFDRGCINNEGFSEIFIAFAAFIEDW